MYSFAHNLFSYCLRVTHIQLDFPFCVWVFAFMDENEIMATQSPRAHTIIPIMRRATTSRAKNTTNKNYGNNNCFFRWCCLKQSKRVCVVMKSKSLSFSSFSASFIIGPVCFAWSLFFFFLYLVLCLLLVFFSLHHHQHDLIGFLFSSSVAGQFSNSIT